MLRKTIGFEGEKRYASLFVLIPEINGTFRINRWSSRLLLKSGCRPFNWHRCTSDLIRIPTLPSQFKKRCIKTTSTVIELDALVRIPDYFMI
ncbi:MAG: hypothetical protein HWD58_06210 [Bacteroidota bacterium]|nr:MAG: hypothetical protein HWD58_06210 [Bacteroidota bacterium]